MNERLALVVVAAIIALAAWRASAQPDDTCVAEGAALIARLHIAAWTSCPSRQLVVPYAEVNELLAEVGR